MKKIAIANRKGGAGKSWSSRTFSSIDADLMRSSFGFGKTWI